jgi:hypothetical protein
MEGCPKVLPGRSDSISKQVVDKVDVSKGLGINSPSKGFPMPVRYVVFENRYLSDNIGCEVPQREIFRVPPR